MYLLIISKYMVTNAVLSVTASALQSMNMGPYLHRIKQSVSSLSPSACLIIFFFGWNFHNTLCFHVMYIQMHIGSINERRYDVCHFESGYCCLMW